MFIFLCVFILFPILTTILIECFPPKTISCLLFILFLNYIQYFASIYFYYLFFEAYNTGYESIEIIYRLGALSFMFLLLNILVGLSISTWYVLLPAFLLNFFNIATIIYFNIMYEIDSNENRPLFSTSSEDENAPHGNSSSSVNTSYPDVEYSANSQRGKYSYERINIVS